MNKKQKIDIDQFQSSISQDQQFQMQSLEEKNLLNNVSQVQDFDDIMLVELHKIHGNKWKKISTYFPKKDDSFIKNHFYSLLRRSLRKINSYIKLKNKLQNGKNKLLKLNFVFKLTNLAESQRNGISNKTYYTNLLYLFLDLKNQSLNKYNTFQQLNNRSYFQGCQNQKIQRLILQLRQIEHFFLQHNLNKKGKSKKKCPKKIFLKKVEIQRSMNAKILDQFQKNDECQTPDQLSPFLHSQQKMQYIGDLLSFDIEDQFHKQNNQILVNESWFDPILFK